MKKISVDKYVEGVNSIYIEQPAYEKGCDGSNGKCDCIGMCRGALIREGAEGIKGMNGTNYAARHTILDLQKIKKVDQLQVGDIVMKVRDKDDANMRLPDQYRKGGNDYSQKWGETNFTHIGTVTQINPLRITHMTSPTAKIDTGLGNWTYFGRLPWVDYKNKQETEDLVVGWATVWAEKGSTVKMRAKPSTLCRLYWEVPVGAQVVLVEPEDTWSGIIYAGQSGYMMTKFLREGEQVPLYTVTIKGLTKEQAEELARTYGGEIVAGLEKEELTWLQTQKSE